MKKLSISILSISLCVTAVSCKRYLNVVPVEFKAEDYIFSDSARAEGFINNAYSDFPADVSNSFNWLEGNAMLASASDEAMHISTNKTVPSAAQRMSNGNWNPSSMRYWRADDQAGNIGSWMKYGGYHGNRKTNTAIKNLHQLPNTVTQRYKDRLMGEAIFLRALYHWFLFQRWGGIPIVDRAFLASDNVLVPRNSVASVVEFIASSCDQAYELLPEDQYTAVQEIGRADRGACMALKAKVLLYAASPLYNRLGEDSLTSYGNVDASRWNAAAQAAQRVVDLGWYQLYNTSVSGRTPYASFFNAWGSGITNNEVIHARLRGPNRDTENDNFPAGFTNARGGTCPSQDLVDAYEMSDGTVFNWNNPTHAGSPYTNRDPRFYASIIYNGATYARFAGQSNYTFQIYTGGVNANGNARTETGYYLNKFMDYANVNPINGSGNTYHNWIYFRYAEVLLNLAEAGNEAGGPSYVVPGALSALTPVQALNLIRARAGMPDVATTFANRGEALDQEKLRQFIRNERRIELSFEDHRYFDVRRWMIIEDLPQFIRGMEITRASDGTLTYNPNVRAESKVFENKHYFFPIPQVEMNRNPSLRQNPDWQL